MRTGIRKTKSSRYNTPLSAQPSPLSGGHPLVPPQIQRQQRERNIETLSGSESSFNFGNIPVFSPASSASHPKQTPKRSRDDFRREKTLSHPQQLTYLNAGINGLPYAQTGCGVKSNAKLVEESRSLQGRSPDKTAGGPTDPVKEQSDTDEISPADDETVEVAQAEDEAEVEAVVNPTISHETAFSAPDGSAKTRTKVGVGEKVTFTGSAAGKWSASGGTPDKLANGTRFEWTAPNRAATPSIKLEVGDKSALVTMDVIEPAGITATKNSEMFSGEAGAGAGMKLTFNYLPKTVSFGNVKAKEVSGPASNITGYFKDNYTAADLYHDSGDLFTSIGADNKDAAEDTAAAPPGFFVSTDYKAGGLDWVIPNHFKVKTEGGDGKEFTKVTQSFRMINTTGKLKITKAGAKVERSPGE